MKLITLLYFLLSCTSFLNGQTILTVSNYTGDGSSDYDNIQEAINAASAGDFIHVYPGNYNEGTIEIAKTVHIIGVGYSLLDNYPSSDWNTDHSYIENTLLIKEEGDNSIIEGFRVEYLIAEECANVLVRKCHIEKASFNNVSSLTLRSCYVEGGVFTGTSYKAQILLENYTELLFQNCIFDTPYNTNSTIGIFRSINSVSSGNIVLEHCIFRNRLSSIATDVVFKVKNSIGLTTFGNMNGSLGTGSCAINSLFETNTIGSVTIINCITSINPIDEFIGYPTSNGYSFDDRFHLLASSQAVGFATDGTDCGVFGGESPYVLSGIPSLPFIYNFDADHEGTTGSGIDVNIKVKSQN